MGRPRLRNDELRDRLLGGALELAAEGGVKAVTTRAVAATAGTSVPAVDELFGGKAGLVRAMFVEGFGRLAARLEMLPSGANPVDDLMEVAWSFRAFALEERALYEVMFSRPFAEFEPGPSDLNAAVVVHRVIMERVNALLGPGSARARRKDAAVALSAVMSGLAGMERSGILGSAPSSVKRRWRLTVLSTLHGLEATDVR